MEFNKKSSQPVQMVVRAASNTRSNYYTKNRAHKRDLNHALLPNACDYYSERLNKFRRGKTQATALCPFHDDHNPSLSINLKTGAFFCFSCGACGKSIIGFYSKFERISFDQACKALGVIRG